MSVKKSNRMVEIFLFLFLSSLFLYPLSVSAQKKIKPEELFQMSLEEVKLPAASRGASSAQL